MGPAAEGQFAGVQRRHGRRAQVRQGDLGRHGEARRRHRFRTSRRTDVPDLVFRRQARRHGGVLRRHHRLQLHLRRALYLDAPEAHPGFAFRQSQAGGGGQQIRHRPSHLAMYVGGVSVGPDPARSHDDVEEPACARQYGGAGRRAAPRAQDLRRHARSGAANSAAADDLPFLWRIVRPSPRRRRPRRGKGIVGQRDLQAASGGKGDRPHSAGHAAWSRHRLDRPPFRRPGRRRGWQGTRKSSACRPRKRRRARRGRSEFR